MKVLTIESLRAFLEELERRYGKEFYSKTEADTKFQQKGDAYTKEESDNRYQQKGESSGGGDVDFQELARRIPSWQWKVTLPKSEHQTVTATVGSQTYTENFYAQQGSQVTFNVKADDGFKAGTLSLESVTLTEDVAVTVTDATWEFVLDAKALFEATSEEQTTMKQVTFPAFAKVVEIYGYNKTGEKVHSEYIKPLSHSEPYTIRTSSREVAGDNGEKIYFLGTKTVRKLSDVAIQSPIRGDHPNSGLLIISGSKFFTKLVIAWSPEIGAQTPDIEG